MAEENTEAEQLDVSQINEFDFYSRLTGPLILQVPNAADRAKASAWIKKLKEENIGSAKLRTEYLKLLIFVLQKGKLTGIFSDDPALYTELVDFTKHFNVNEFARCMLEKVEIERIERIKREFNGECGETPVNSDFSTDLLEYCASQDIPNFGVHTFYAFSKEPFTKWYQSEKAIAPKVRSLLEDLDEKVCICTEHPECPNKGEGKEEKHKPLGLMPPVHPMGIVNPKDPCKTRPPIWGSVTIDIKDTGDKKTRRRKSCPSLQELGLSNEGRSRDTSKTTPSRKSRLGPKKWSTLDQADQISEQLNNLQERLDNLKQQISLGNVDESFDVMRNPPETDEPTQSADTSSGATQRSTSVPTGTADRQQGVCPSRFPPHIVGSHRPAPRTASLAPPQPEPPPEKPRSPTLCMKKWGISENLPGVGIAPPPPPLSGSHKPLPTTSALGPAPKPEEPPEILRPPTLLMKKWGAFESLDEMGIASMPPPLSGSHKPLPKTAALGPVPQPEIPQIRPCRPVPSFLPVSISGTTRPFPRTASRAPPQQPEVPQEILQTPRPMPSFLPVSISGTTRPFPRTASRATPQQPELPQEIPTPLPMPCFRPMSISGSTRPMPRTAALGPPQQPEVPQEILPTPLPMPTFRPMSISGSTRPMPRTAALGPPQQPEAPQEIPTPLPMPCFRPMSISGSTRPMPRTAALGPPQQPEAPQEIPTPLPMPTFRPMSISGTTRPMPRTAALGPPQQPEAPQEIPTPLPMPTFRPMSISGTTRPMPRTAALGPPQQPEVPQEMLPTPLPMPTFRPMSISGTTRPMPRTAALGPPPRPEEPPEIITRRSMPCFLPVSISGTTRPFPRTASRGPPQQPEVPQEILQTPRPMPSFLPVSISGTTRPFPRTASRGPPQQSEVPQEILQTPLPVPTFRPMSISGTTRPMPRTAALGPPPRPEEPPEIIPRRSMPCFLPVPISGTTRPFPRTASRGPPQQPEVPQEIPTPLPIPTFRPMSISGTTRPFPRTASRVPPQEIPLTRPLPTTAAKRTCPAGMEDSSQVYGSAEEQLGQLYQQYPNMDVSQSDVSDPDVYWYAWKDRDGDVSDGVSSHGGTSAAFVCGTPGGVPDPRTAEFFNQSRELSPIATPPAREEVAQSRLGTWHSMEMPSMAYNWLPPQACPRGNISLPNPTRQEQAPEELAHLYQQYPAENQERTPPLFSRVPEIQQAGRYLQYDREHDIMVPQTINWTDAQQFLADDTGIRQREAEVALSESYEMPFLQSSGLRPPQISYGGPCGRPEDFGFNEGIESIKGKQDLSRSLPNPITESILDYIQFRGGGECDRTSCTSATKKSKDDEDEYDLERLAELGFTVEELQTISADDIQVSDISGFEDVQSDVSEGPAMQTSMERELEAFDERLNLLEAEAQEDFKFVDAYEAGLILDADAVDTVNKSLSECSNQIKSLLNSLSPKQGTSVAQISKEEDVSAPVSASRYGAADTVYEEVPEQSEQNIAKSPVASTSKIQSPKIKKKTDKTTSKTEKRQIPCRKPISESDIATKGTKKAIPGVETSIRKTKTLGQLSVKTAEKKIPCGKPKSESSIAKPSAKTKVLPDKTAIAAKKGIKKPEVKETESLSALEKRKAYAKQLAASATTTKVVKKVPKKEDKQGPKPPIKEAGPIQTLEIKSLEKSVMETTIQQEAVKRLVAVSPTRNSPKEILDESAAVLQILESRPVDTRTMETTIQQEGVQHLVVTSPTSKQVEQVLQETSTKKASPKKGISKPGDRSKSASVVKKAVKKPEVKETQSMSALEKRKAYALKMAATKKPPCKKVPEKTADETMPMQILEIKPVDASVIETTTQQEGVQQLAVTSPTKRQIEQVLQDTSTKKASPKKGISKPGDRSKSTNVVKKAVKKPEVKETQSMSSLEKRKAYALKMAATKKPPCKKVPEKTAAETVPMQILEIKPVDASVIETTTQQEGVQQLGVTSPTKKQIEQVMQDTSKKVSPKEDRAKSASVIRKSVKKPEVKETQSASALEKRKAYTAPKPPSKKVTKKPDKKSPEKIPTEEAPEKAKVPEKPKKIEPTKAQKLFIEKQKKIKGELEELYKSLDVGQKKISSEEAIWDVTPPEMRREVFQLSPLFGDTVVDRKSLSVEEIPWDVTPPELRVERPRTPPVFSRHAKVRELGQKLQYKPQEFKLKDKRMFWLEAPTYLEENKPEKLFLGPDEAIIERRERLDVPAEFRQKTWQEGIQELILEEEKKQELGFVVDFGGPSKEKKKKTPPKFTRKKKKLPSPEKKPEEPEETSKPEPKKRKPPLKKKAPEVAAKEGDGSTVPCGKAEGAKKDVKGKKPPEKEKISKKKPEEDEKTKKKVPSTKEKVLTKKAPCGRPEPKKKDKVAPPETKIKDKSKKKDLEELKEVEEPSAVVPCAKVKTPERLPSPVKPPTPPKPVSPTKPKRSKRKKRSTKKYEDDLIFESPPMMDIMDVSWELPASSIESQIGDVSPMFAEMTPPLDISLVSDVSFEASPQRTPTPKTVQAPMDEFDIPALVGKSDFQHLMDDVKAKYEWRKDVKKYKKFLKQPLPFATQTAPAPLVFDKNRWSDPRPQPTQYSPVPYKKDLSLRYTDPSQMDPEIVQAFKRAPTPAQPIRWSDPTPQRQPTDYADVLLQYSDPGRKDLIPEELVQPGPRPTRQATLQRRPCPKAVSYSASLSDFSFEDDKLVPIPTMSPTTAAKYEETLRKVRMRQPGYQSPVPAPPVIAPSGYQSPVAAAPVIAPSGEVPPCYQPSVVTPPEDQGVFDFDKPMPDYTDVWEQYGEKYDPLLTAQDIFNLEGEALKQAVPAGVLSHERSPPMLNVSAESDDFPVCVTPPSVPPMYSPTYALSPTPRKSPESKKVSPPKQTQPDRKGPKAKATSSKTSVCKVSKPAAKKKKVVEVKLSRGALIMKKKEEEAKAKAAAAAAALAARKAKARKKVSSKKETLPPQEPPKLPSPKISPPKSPPKSSPVKTPSPKVPSPKPPSPRPPSPLICEGYEFTVDDDAVGLFDIGAPEGYENLLGTPKADTGVAGLVSVSTPKTDFFDLPIVPTLSDERRKAWMEVRREEALRQEMEFQRRASPMITPVPMSPGTYTPPGPPPQPRPPRTVLETPKMRQKRPCSRKLFAEERVPTPQRVSPQIYQSPPGITTPTGVTVLPQITDLMDFSPEKSDVVPQFSTPPCGTCLLDIKDALPEGLAAPLTAKIDLPEWESPKLRPKLRTSPMVMQEPMALVDLRPEKDTMFFEAPPEDLFAGTDLTLEEEQLEASLELMPQLSEFSPRTKYRPYEKTFPVDIPWETQDPMELLAPCQKYFTVRVIPPSPEDRPLLDVTPLEEPDSLTLALRKTGGKIFSQSPPVYFSPDEGDIIEETPPLLTSFSPVMSPVMETPPYQRIPLSGTRSPTFEEIEARKLLEAAAAGEPCRKKRLRFKEILAETRTFKADEIIDPSVVQRTGPLVKKTQTQILREKATRPKVAKAKTSPKKKPSIMKKVQSEISKEKEPEKIEEAEAAPKKKEQKVRAAAPKKKPPIVVKKTQSQILREKLVADAKAAEAKAAEAKTAKGKKGAITAKGAKTSKGTKKAPCGSKDKSKKITEPPPAPIPDKPPTLPEYATPPDMLEEMEMEPFELSLTPTKMEGLPCVISNRRYRMMQKEEERVERELAMLPSPILRSTDFTPPINYYVESPLAERIKGPRRRRFRPPDEMGAVFMPARRKLDFDDSAEFMETTEQQQQIQLPMQQIQVPTQQIQSPIQQIQLPPQQIQSPIQQIQSPIQEPSPQVTSPCKPCISPVSGKFEGFKDYAEYMGEEYKPPDWKEEAQKLAWSTPEHLKSMNILEGSPEVVDLEGGFLVDQYADRFGGLDDELAANLLRTPSPVKRPTTPKPSPFLTPQTPPYPSLASRPSPFLSAQSPRTPLRYSPLSIKPSPILTPQAATPTTRSPYGYTPMTIKPSPFLTPKTPSTKGATPKPSPYLTPRSPGTPSYYIMEEQLPEWEEEVFPQSIPVRATAQGDFTTPPEQVIPQVRMTQASRKGESAPLHPEEFYSPVYSCVPEDLPKTPSPTPFTQPMFDIRLKTTVVESQLKSQAEELGLPTDIDMYTQQGETDAQICRPEDIDQDYLEAQQYFAELDKIERQKQLVAARIQKEIPSDYGIFSQFPQEPEPSQAKQPSPPSAAPLTQQQKNVLAMLDKMEGRLNVLKDEVVAEAKPPVEPCKKKTKEVVVRTSRSQILREKKLKEEEEKRKAEEEKKAAAAQKLAKRKEAMKKKAEGKKKEKTPPKKTPTEPPPESNLQVETIMGPVQPQAKQPSPPSAAPLTQEQKNVLAMLDKMEGRLNVLKDEVIAETKPPAEPCKKKTKEVVVRTSRSQILREKKLKEEEEKRKAEEEKKAAAAQKLAKRKEAMKKKVEGKKTVGKKKETTPPRICTPTQPPPIGPFLPPESPIKVQTVMGPTLDMTPPWELDLHASLLDASEDEFGFPIGETEAEKEMREELRKRIERRDREFGRRPSPFITPRVGPPSPSPPRPVLASPGTPPLWKKTVDSMQYAAQRVSPGSIWAQQQKLPPSPQKLAAVEPEVPTTSAPEVPTKKKAPEKKKIEKKPKALPVKQTKSQLLKVEKLKQAKKEEKKKDLMAIRKAKAERERKKQEALIKEEMERVAWELERRPSVPSPGPSPSRTPQYPYFARRDPITGELVFQFSPETKKIAEEMKQAKQVTPTNVSDDWLWQTPESLKSAVPAQTTAQTRGIRGVKLFDSPQALPAPAPPDYEQIRKQQEDEEFLRAEQLFAEEEMQMQLQMDQQQICPARQPSPQAQAVQDILPMTRASPAQIQQSMQRSPVPEQVYPARQPSPQAQAVQEMLPMTRASPAQIQQSMQRSPLPEQVCPARQPSPQAQAVQEMLPMTRASPAQIQQSMQRSPLPEQVYPARQPSPQMQQPMAPIMDKAKMQLAMLQDSPIQQQVCPARQPSPRVPSPVQQPFVPATSPLQLAASGDMLEGSPPWGLDMDVSPQLSPGGFQLEGSPISQTCPGAMLEDQWTSLAGQPPQLSPGGFQLAGSPASPTSPGILAEDQWVDQLPQLSPGGFQLAGSPASPTSPGILAGDQWVDQLPQLSPADMQLLRTPPGERFKERKELSPETLAMFDYTPPPKPRTPPPAPVLAVEPEPVTEPCSKKGSAEKKKAAEEKEEKKGKKEEKKGKKGAEKKKPKTLLPKTTKSQQLKIDRLKKEKEKEEEAARKKKELIERRKAKEERERKKQEALIKEEMERVAWEMERRPSVPSAGSSPSRTPQYPPYARRDPVTGDLVYQFSPETMKYSEQLRPQYEGVPMDFTVDWKSPEVEKYQYESIPAAPFVPPPAPCVRRRLEFPEPPMQHISPTQAAMPQLTSPTKDIQLLSLAESGDTGLDFTDMPQMFSPTQQQLSPTQAAMKQAGDLGLDFATMPQMFSPTQQQLSPTQAAMIQAADLGLDFAGMPQTFSPTQQQLSPTQAAMIQAADLGLDFPGMPQTFSPTQQQLSPTQAAMIQAADLGLDFPGMPQTFSPTQQQLSPTQAAMIQAADLGLDFAGMPQTFSPTQQPQVCPARKSPTQLSPRTPQAQPTSPLSPEWTTPGLFDTGALETSIFDEDYTDLLESSFGVDELASSGQDPFALSVSGGYYSSGREDEEVEGDYVPGPESPPAPVAKQLRQELRRHKYTEEFYDKKRETMSKQLIIGGKCVTLKGKQAPGLANIYEQEAMEQIAAKYYQPTSPQPQYPMQQQLPPIVQEVDESEPQSPQMAAFDWSPEIYTSPQTQKAVDYIKSAYGSPPKSTPKKTPSPRVCTPPVPPSPPTPPPASPPSEAWGILEALGTPSSRVEESFSDYSDYSMSPSPVKRTPPRESPRVAQALQGTPSPSPPQGEQLQMMLREHEYTPEFYDLNKEYLNRHMFIGQKMVKLQDKKKPDLPDVYEEAEISSPRVCTPPVPPSPPRPPPTSPPSDAWGILQALGTPTSRATPASAAWGGTPPFGTEELSFSDNFEDYSMSSPGESPSPPRGKQLQRKLRKHEADYDFKREYLNRHVFIGQKMVKLQDKKKPDLPDVYEQAEISDDEIYEPPPQRSPCLNVQQLMASPEQSFNVHQMLNISTTDAALSAELPDIVNAELTQHDKEALELLNKLEKQLSMLDNPDEAPPSTPKSLKRDTPLTDGDTQVVLVHVFENLTPGQIKLLKDAWSCKNVDKVVTMFKKIKLTRRDLHTLREGQWIADNVLNFYFNLIMERNKRKRLARCYIFELFMYPKLKAEGAKGIRELLKGVDVTKLDLIMVPIVDSESGHITLAVIDTKQQTINHYDSSGGTNKECFSVLKKFLTEEHKHKTGKSLCTKGYQYNNDPLMPLHVYAEDCGVFVLTAAEFLSRGKERLMFDFEDVPFLRQKITAEIMAKTLFMS